MVELYTPEGWAYYNLGELFSFKNGLNAEKEQYGHGIKFINVMEIFSHDTITYEVIKDKVQASDKQIKEYLVKAGDVLFNRTSEIPEEIALSALYIDDEPVIFGGFVIRARPLTKKMLPEYCRYIFNVSSIRREFIRRSQGAIRSNIGQSDLRLVRLYVPPLPEQQAIANVLSTWDRGIQQLTSLLEAKRERKAALMQRMLTGKVRLPEFAGQEWKSTQLGKISTILKKEPLSDLSGECLLTVKLHCKGIEKNERITPKLSEKGRSYFKRNAGEFIIGRQNFHNGGFGIVPVELDGLIASSAITSIKIDDQKALKEFVLYYFSREEYYIKAGDRIGGTGQKEFSDKELRSLPIKLPSLKEQTCIAAILSAADLEITQLEQKLEAIREQKKGLMQQLLTGKKRVNIQNKEAA